MFKGHKNVKAEFPYFKNKHDFSPPESNNDDIYKSYVYVTGLLVVWALYNTFEFGNDWNKNNWKNENLEATKNKLKEIWDNMFEGDDDQKPR